MAAKRVPYKGIKSLILNDKLQSMSQLVKGKKPKGELGIKKGELAQLKKKNPLYKKMSQY